MGRLVGRGTRATFEPPRRPAPLAALVAPPTGVPTYGISTFSERVVLVVDVSGSMAEKGPEQPGRPAGERKIDAARREVAAALDGLDERRARFGVVLFDRGVRRFGAGLLKADVASRGAARAVAAREPSGETNLYDALREAFQLARSSTARCPRRRRRHRVPADGRQAHGRRRRRVGAHPRRGDAVEPRPSRIMVHCVGVGAHDAGLLQALSSLTGGQYVRR